MVPGYVSLEATETYWLLSVIIFGRVLLGSSVAGCLPGDGRPGLLEWGLDDGFPLNAELGFLTQTVG
jgi:hypothetical protein